MGKERNKYKYISRSMDIKSIEWDRPNREEFQDWPKFISAERYIVGGTNGYSGKFADTGGSMLLFDGMGVAHFKKISAVAEDT